MTYTYKYYNNREWWKDRFGEELKMVCPNCRKKLEPLSDEEISNLYFSGIVFEENLFAAFKAGYRMAEKHHGIEDKK